jgi:hypothetical protein
MKGFIRILESFIASLILFTSITYFFSVPSYSFWDSASVGTTVQDTITVLHLNGDFNTAITNNDNQPIRDVLAVSLPATTEYSIQITGAPSPEIKIHCVCTQLEAEEIEDRLDLIGNQFSYKGRNIKILISADPDINNVDTASDLILFIRLDDVKNEKNRLEFWLDNEKNVMLLQELREEYFDVGVDTKDVLENVFGLEWKPGTSSAGGTIIFNNTEDVSKLSYRISKYFSQSSIYPVEEQFDFPEKEGSTDLNRVGVDKGVVVVRQHPGQGQDVKDYSLVNVRETNGRATWFADYDATTSSGGGIPDNDDINKLLRAMFMYSSGEQYIVVDSVLPEKQPYLSYDLLGSIEGDLYTIHILIWSAFY